MVPVIESRIRLIHGDITRIDADAIVTAANSALRGGGGVDGAVHGAAGPELLAASLALAPCPAGEARITDGFKLTSRFVIHAVGPIFSDLDVDSLVLAAAYKSALSLAAEQRVKSVAFPCISTGVFGFPHDAACDIAIATVMEWLGTHPDPEKVIFCCFGTQDFDRYHERLEKLGVVP